MLYKEWTNQRTWCLEYWKYTVFRTFLLHALNNPEFENYLGQIYPAELEIKDTTESITSASYLDFLLSIGIDGQLYTSIYDKRDDFNFHITNFSFLSSNITSSPAYGVFLSQLIRYTRACSSYECLFWGPGDFPVSYSKTWIPRGTLEIVIQEVLLSIRGSYSAIRSIPLTNVKWHSDPWPTMTFQPIRLSTNFMTLIPSLALTDHEWFPWSICNGCGMPAGNAYPSGHLVPSPIVELTCAPIVQTRFLELAMS